MLVKLETAGLVCPFPLMEAKEAMAKLNKGDGIIIEFDCTQATEAIPAWAAEEGYEVTDFEQIDDAKWTMTVIK
ncbi:sulfurtransferase TusA family protein [Actinobacillus porcinus]|uniref:sulfurtransferase TusA family protein n=1 Tax=Actinobacillus porcinus TaxID=51048 RepID=UPI002357BAF0|nr:sulfurtransferase TusA family protein [Actinobacillus porcinus]MDD7569571.1 sulfurtransferase TusA family protein [[Actinobacillus] rossii]MDY5793721.1 sulfurtransferase TusA family protein [[Actinobacillus] rossii]MDY6215989.1 sulfurtransferase TusA family protein [Actinobacillus porcinus]